MLQQEKMKADFEKIVEGYYILQIKLRKVYMQMTAGSCRVLLENIWINLSAFSTVELKDFIMD